jgi:hypothetical protein
MQPHVTNLQYLLPYPLKPATYALRPENCGIGQMNDVTTELDQMQAAYKAAVEEWVSAIRREEELASVNHEIADVDKWEQAHFTEDGIRNKVKAAKKRYEDALREKFFGF